jgi:hypothetical protein
MFTLKKHKKNLKRNLEVLEASCGSNRSRSFAEPSHSATTPYIEGMAKYLKV